MAERAPAAGIGLRGALILSLGINVTNAGISYAAMTETRTDYSHF